MVNNRTFCISGSMFSEYKTVVNLDLTDSKKDIINVVMNRIREDMKQYPKILHKLDKMVQENFYHIHDYKFGDILISEPETIFYLCSHCEKKRR
jgi:hypothetical protein|tara:strand:+ start:126 stop:407 length:282 start_codon:yes stop_codon:yes gene_type:complete